MDLIVEKSFSFYFLISNIAPQIHYFMTIQEATIYKLQKPLIKGFFSIIFPIFYIVQTSLYLKSTKDFVEIYIYFYLKRVKLFDDNLEFL